MSMNVNNNNPFAAQIQSDKSSQAHGLLAQGTIASSSTTQAVVIPPAQSPSIPIETTTLSKPNPNSNPTTIMNWVPMASPGAMIMSLVVDGAAEQRKGNRDNMQMQAKELILTMEAEAKEIRRNAVNQLVCGIVSGSLQIAGGLASGMIASKIGPMGKGGDIVVAGKAQAFNTAFGGASSIVGSTGQYLGSMSQAIQKDLQISQERLRINRDELKSFNDSLQELISKVISSMDAIQGNVNQTRTKILG